jgi:hypothetical protein
MKSFFLCAALFAGTMLVTATPVAAQGEDDGVSFGVSDDLNSLDACDYYKYYETAPPWGMPDRYCDDLVAFDPVYYDGVWYQGPIFYRWKHGHKMHWLKGDWREETKQAPPSTIVWHDSGALNRGFKPGVFGHGGVAPRDALPERESGHGGSGAHLSTESHTTPETHSASETRTPEIHAAAPEVHTSAPESHNDTNSSHGDSSSSHASSSASSGGSPHH